MPSKTQNQPPLSRLSRISIGLGLKAPTASPRPRTREIQKRAAKADEDWYIPYNGPYETPMEPIGRQKERDSWGDLIHGEEDNDTVLADQELYNRYGGHDPTRDDHSHPAVDGDGGGNEHNGRASDRTRSVVSHGVVSSVPVANKRKGAVLRRRSTHANPNPRQQIPSYVSLDVAGGVGESPMPVQRASYASSGGNDTNRATRASFFAFGGPSKKLPPSPSGFSFEHTPDKPSLQGPPRPDRSKSTTRPDERLSRAYSPLLRQSSSSEWNRNNPMTRIRRENAVALAGVRGSGTTDEEDYYNSYYSTLISMTATGNSRPHFAHVDSSDLPRSAKQRHPPHAPEKNNPPTREYQATPTQHPYAYVFPSAEVDRAPQTVPSFPTAKPKFNEAGTTNHHNRHPPPLTFISPSENPQSAPLSHFAVARPPGGASHPLKNSISTPNLRSASRSPQGQSQPKSKDHWLSAVTWCDALIFPRPRLIIREEGEFVHVGSGMIVSPPDSPLRDTGGNTGEEVEKRQLQQGMESRVLAHSRSLADIANVTETSSPGAGPSTPSKRVPSRTRGATLPSRPKTAPTPNKSRGEEIPDRRAPRRMSFAQDDLALPSPVPSLARVLEEGQLLEHRRKKWQIQASESFQNKRTRSISRTRSKSLTYRQGKRKDNEGQKPQSAIDFLAARSFLGNQALVPIVSQPVRNRSISHENAGGKVGKVSHSHSNSLAKSLSKSSKASRGHSRNDSWSKSAFKVAKSTAALCGLNGDGKAVSPLNEKSSSSDRGSKEDGTKIVTVAPQIPIDRDAVAPPGNTHPPRNGVSPSFSDVSDAQVGIAVTTAPQADDAVDHGSIRVPAHPYAQGGLYAYSHKVSAVPEHRHDRGLDYTAPQPSTVTAKRPGTHDGSIQHRPPPQTFLHPYALASSRDSYQSEAKITPYPRQDSNVPPSSKMWAMSSGVVREVLPNEIQYSPFIPDKSPPPDVGPSHSLDARNSKMICDMVGVGEALAYAIRRRRSQDSVGSNEDVTITQANHQAWAEADEENLPATDPGSLSPKHIHRTPVQYDATRPPYLQTSKKTSDPSTNHTLTLPPPDQLNSPDFRPPSTGFANHSSHSSPGVTSQGSSPQLSPRPLGSVDDLEHFHDLFYRPNLAREPSIDMIQSPVPRNPGVPVDVSSHSRRTGSGLTSLARQLSEEFEELNAQRELSSHSDSSSSRPAQHQGDFAGTTVDTSLQFVFSDVPQITSPTQSNVDLSPGSILAFHNLPEDVGSSRASSIMERSLSEDDDTQLFRLGQVESVTTPPPMSSDHRMSGHLSFIEEHTGHRGNNTSNPGNRIISHPSLRPPTVDLTRTSYTTNSTGSRISGLSDFPVPPVHDHMPPAHISLLSPYFDEALAQKEARSSAPSVPRPSSSCDMSSGQEEDADGLAAPLPSHRQ